MLICSIASRHSRAEIIGILFNRKLLKCFIEIKCEDAEEEPAEPNEQF